MSFRLSFVLCPQSLLLICRVHPTEVWVCVQTATWSLPPAPGCGRKVLVPPLQVVGNPPHVIGGLRYARWRGCTTQWNLGSIRRSLPDRWAGCALSPSSQSTVCLRLPQLLDGCGLARIRVMHRG